MVFFIILSNCYCLLDPHYCFRMSRNIIFKLWPFVLFIQLSMVMLHNETLLLVYTYLLECWCFGPVMQLQLQTTSFAFWWNSFSLCRCFCPRACCKMSCCQLYFQCHIIASPVSIVAHNLWRNWLDLLGQVLNMTIYDRFCGIFHTESSSFVF